MKKKKVAFLCVHNSCRSQIAEALMKKYGSHLAEVYSAGTALKSQINPDAVRLMKVLYGIDMEESQTPKLLTDIPAVEQVITMGCNVTCPSLPYQYDTEDWGLDDPTGKSDQAFIAIISEIDERVRKLIQQLEQS
ncbi:arsenate reductase ArsC [Streptococcus pacificus]|uniref:Arsenate reductase ArsC n=1 Tax=Streptococcus pacificus TaxID=2740577 RepID=A0ABS0ZGX2_9STRE|nr:arsenate reductase ArsC [Streptococcus pacificus]MBJ8325259.1 arsenate reductase ArsC [Streptococcus pacificus]